MSSPLPKHEFEHAGSWYEVLPALLTDHPAIYAVEVTRRTGADAPRQSLITLTIRADVDHESVHGMGMLDTAFQRGEALIKSMYL